MTEKPLRFCMVTTFYPPYNFGGDGIFVHGLSNELARRGHRVEVIHCKDAYRAVAGRAAEGGYDDHPNVTVHGLESPFGLLSPLATQQTGRPFFKTAALRRILENDFDVVHFHNISLLGPAVLEHGRGIKLYTMHEYWLVCPTHVLFRFNRAACERPYCFACTLAHRRPPQWWRYTDLLKTAVEHVDAFIAPSRFSEDKHREMGLEAPVVQLGHFIPDEVDGEGSGEAKNSGMDETPYFLFVGRLEKIKGLQTLIPIFRGYRKARLLIAGSGDYRPHLERLAEESDNIRFLGHCSKPELQALYARAVAVIVPSLCFESFGLVIIEAFKHHTPVIVREIGALPEIVACSGGGLVYRTDGELPTRMDELLEDPSKRAALGDDGYEAYLTNWTPEAHLSRYLALIREIGANRKFAGRPGSLAAVK